MTADVRDPANKSAWCYFRHVRGGQLFHCVFSDTSLHENSGKFTIIMILKRKQEIKMNDLNAIYSFRKDY